ncbi:hypothetical protein B0H10DRAFT_2079105, partial [Mycena sp. CBHHK59/15]
YLKGKFIYYVFTKVWLHVVSNIHILHTPSGHSHHKDFYKDPFCCHLYNLPFYTFGTFFLACLAFHCDKASAVAPAFFFQSCGSG